MSTLLAKDQPSHTVRFQGKIRVFTCGLPEESLVDLSENGTHHMYATCWIDGSRGKSSHVAFPSQANVGESAQGPETMFGTFALELDYRDAGDSNAVKIQFCIRMLDPDSHNRRSAEICMGHAWADKMLQGETDRFRVANQFTEGNYIDVEMLAVNARDYRNHSSNAGVMSRPLITFSPSKLAQLAEGNQDMRQLTDDMVSVLKKNHAVLPDEAEGFVPGLTRSFFLFLHRSPVLADARALPAANRLEAGSTLILAKQSIPTLSRITHPCTSRLTALPGSCPTSLSCITCTSR